MSLKNVKSKDQIKIYVDMDGTIVDFISQVNKYDFWRKDKTDKVDWKKVKTMGSRFWSEMDWIPDAQQYFSYLCDRNNEGLINLYILSSIDFEEGKEGKRQWLKKHTNIPLEKIIFVTEPEDKAVYATFDSLLIDDRKKSLIPFKEAGGMIIEFKGDWFKTYMEIEKKLCNHILANSKKLPSYKEPQNILYEFMSEASYQYALDDSYKKRGFVIDEEGNYYSKKEVFELQDLSEAEKSILHISKKLNTQFVYDLIYNSPDLALKVRNIIEKYSKEINNIPETVHQYGVCDGSVEYFRFGKKTISGCNILTPDERPYVKHKRPSYVPENISNEQYDANENSLVVLNNIYLDINKALKNNE